MTVICTLVLETWAEEGGRGSEERGRQQVVSYMYICLTGHSIVLSTNCEDNERVFLTI